VHIHIHIRICFFPFQFNFCPSGFARGLKGSTQLYHRCRTSGLERRVQVIYSAAPTTPFLSSYSLPRAFALAGVTFPSGRMAVGADMVGFANLPNCLEPQPYEFNVMAVGEAGVGSLLFHLCIELSLSPSRPPMVALSSAIPEHNHSAAQAYASRTHAHAQLRAHTCVMLHSHLVTVFLPRASLPSLPRLASQPF
jgi:hypothetical protein